MELENSEQVEAVVLDTGSGQTLVADLPSDENEGENAVETEATRIAEINGETTIAVAAIEADVETARIDADRERNATWDAEKETLQASILELTNQVSELTTKLLSAEASPLTLTPEGAAETVAEAAAEAAAEIAEEPPAIVEEPNSTQEFTPDPTSSIVTEAIADAVEESPVAIVIPARARRRLI